MYVRPAIATCWDIDNDLGRNESYLPKTQLIFKILKVIVLIKTSLIWASLRENLSSVVCDQVRLKPVCLATETSERLETLGLATIGIILSKQWKKKCWSDCVDAQPLLFTYGINRFSHDVAHLIPKMVTFKKFNPNWHFRGWFRTGGQCVFFGIHDLPFFISIIHTATKLG